VNEFFAIARSLTWRAVGVGVDDGDFMTVHLRTASDRGVKSLHLVNPPSEARPCPYPGSTRIAPQKAPRAARVVMRSRAEAVGISPGTLEG
jgi:hypothetical protein